MSEKADNHAEGTGGDVSKGAAVRTLVRLALPPLLGVLIAFGALKMVVLPRLGLATVERIARLADRLDAGLGEVPTAVFIGNSLTVEGVDASAAQDAAPPGWRVLNLGVNGCDVEEQRVLAGALLEAAPRVVVLTLRSEDIGRVQNFALDKAYAYGLHGFRAHWPSAWTRDDLPGLTRDRYEALHTSELRATTHFRTVPVNWANEVLRAKLRRGVRRVAPDDWVSPHDLTASISGDRLETHLRTIRAEFDERIGENDSRMGGEDIRKLVAQIGASGAMPVLVMVPIRPQLRDRHARFHAELEALLRELAGATGGIFADATELVGEDGFADAMHLNEEGRLAYSTFVGRLLPLPPSGTPQAKP